MEITMQSIQENEILYNANIEKMIKERTRLMEKVKLIRIHKQNLEDGLEIANLEFEEAKLIQQINDITEAYKEDKLTLEMLEVQKNALKMQVDKKGYADKVKTIKKAKEDLFRNREKIYCENEVEKCKKALQLYRLICDEKSIDEWQEKFKKAKEDLKYAEEEIQKNNKESKKQKNAKESEKEQTGYSIEESDGKVTEIQEQVLTDNAGKPMGYRTIRDELELETGKKTIITSGELENDDGEYVFSEISEGIDSKLEKQRKEMSVNNKITGEKEKYVYEKDKDGKEIYYRRSNEMLTYKITKTKKGIVIDSYEKGQINKSYEYDKNGNALMGMEGIDKLEENYVENFFDSQVPYFEVQSRQITHKGQSILESAIEATEQTTMSNEISKQVQNIKSIQAEKVRQQSGIQK